MTFQWLVTKTNANYLQEQHMLSFMSVAEMARENIMMVGKKTLKKRKHGGCRKIESFCMARMIATENVKLCACSLHFYTHQP